MRDVGGIRKYTRDFLDLEAEDLSDTLIDAWIMEGYRKIVRAARRWPHFESSWELITTSGVREVELPEDVEEIDAIEGPWGNLALVDEAQARNMFNVYTAAPQSGQPAVFTRHGSVLRIYPIPDTVYELRMLGWRKPLEWMDGSAGAAPDFPEDCEDALLAWVMHRAYTHQDDPEMAAAEMARFVAALDEMVGFHKQGDLAQPMVMGGSRRSAGLYTGERPHPTWGFVR